MAHWADPQAQQVAAQLGATIGGGIGALLNRSNRQNAIRAVAEYAQSGEAYHADPEVFAAGLMKVLAENNATPGEMSRYLIAQHRADWTRREGQRVAEEKRAVEEAKRAELVGRAQALEAANAPTVPAEPEGEWQLSPQAMGVLPQREAAQAFIEADPDGYVKGMRDRFFAKPEKAERPQFQQDAAGNLYRVEADGRMVPANPPGWQPKPEATKAPDFKQDSAGNLYRVKPDGTLEPANPEGWQPKPQGGGESSLAKMIADRDKLPAGHPDRAIYDAAIKKATTNAKGLRVKASADGTVEVSQDDVDVAPAKPTQAKVEKDILDTGQTLQRLKILESGFDKTLQQVGPRFGAAWSAGKDKLGMQLNASEKLNLQRMTVQRKQAFDVLNNELNRLSGAAISESEMKRLSQGLPNPGTGVMDGDSPEVFSMKLKSSINSVRLVMARLSYVRRNGLAIGDVSLESMPSLMTQRGQAIEKELRAKGMPEKDAISRARAMLADEFGLMR